VAVTSFSAAPLQFVTFLGAIFFVGAVVLGVQTLVNYFIGHAMDGFTTVILLLLVIGSVLMFSLGLIGTYVARIFDEIKQRPRYIVSETLLAPPEDRGREGAEPVSDPGV